MNTTKPLLFGDQLAKLIDECIADLEEGGGTKLSDLATLMQCLAVTTNVDIYFILPQAIGSFMGEVLLFRQLISIPILEDNIRQRYRQKLENAIATVIESLKVLKYEFCQSESINDSKVVTATAAITKSGYSLYEIREAVLRSQPRTQPYREE